MRNSSAVQNAVIWYIKEQDIKSFKAATKNPEFAKLINVPDQDGQTILMHLAKNPSPFAVEALQLLIEVAEEHKINKAELLNYVHPHSSDTPLLTCVKSEGSLPGLLMFLEALLDHGANPLLNVEGNLLNQLSANNKLEFKADAVLKQAVLDCNAKIRKLSLELRSQVITPAEKLKRYQASLTCSTQVRQSGTGTATELTSPASPPFKV